jgi:hypothetical protein
MERAPGNHHVEDVCNRAVVDKEMKIKILMYLLEIDSSPFQPTACLGFLNKKIC